MMSAQFRVVLLAVVGVFSGCALPVPKVDLSAPLVPASGRTFVLNEATDCSVGTGYGRTLRSGTHWNLFGIIDRGEVYRSPDQLLTVEGFNVHEAYLVVRDGSLVGFYLPVEKKFTPASKIVKLNLSSQQE